MQEKIYQKWKIGERLALERARLGYNQTDFAGIGGVAINTQVRYEKDTSEPTTGYLLNIMEKGADVMFILTGNRSLIASDGRAVYESNRKDGFQTSGQMLAAEIAVLELAADDADAVLHIARKLADT
jgi:transcriptional regulator with XRE-family HTH domain